MFSLVPIVLSLTAVLSFVPVVWAQSPSVASESIPVTDLGRVVIDITTPDPARSWIARAHIDNVRHILSDSPRIVTIAAESLDLNSCEDFACRRRLLKTAEIDLYIEGQLLESTLILRTLVPETEIELSSISIDISAGVAPELVKSGILHALKPFTEPGGILDQKTLLRRAEKLAEGQEAPKFAKQVFGIVLAVLALLVLAAIGTAWTKFPDGRLPLTKLGALWAVFALGPLWLISEDLALIKPVAIFALPQPWMLAVLGGLGCGWAMWGLGLCILPQLRGLESLKQERMRLLIDALSTVILYRLLAFLAWAAVASSLILAARQVFEFDAVHTVALSLVIIGALATATALIFEVLAQALDRKHVVGGAHPLNIWHIKVQQALYAHPLLVDLRDVMDRALILPSTHDRPLAYGGGLSRPRILIPEATLRKAFATRPEDVGVAYDFLAGIVIDGLGKICLRSHLDTTIRLRGVWKGAAVASSGQGFLLAPYRRARQLLEGGFLMVHEGIGPFIQYLYWLQNPESELLTVGASQGQFVAIGRRIVGRMHMGTLPLSINLPRDHICWLIQKFRYTSPEQTPSRARPPFKFKSRLTLVIIALISFIAYQATSAIRYHSIYTERIAAQQSRIDEAKQEKIRKMEAQAYVPAAEPREVISPASRTVKPPKRTKRHAVVAKVSKAKEKAGKRKSKPKPKKRR